MERPAGRSWRDGGEKARRTGYAVRYIFGEYDVNLLGISKLTTLVSSNPAYKAVNRSSSSESSETS